MKLMMIDGNSIVNRAFYGIRMLNAPDGTPTNGVYGFITILQRLLEEERPDGLCVAFDLKAPTFRHLEYEGYKAQRKGMPEELAVQMPILKSVLDAMGIKRVEQEGLEADDLLGSMSRSCGEKGCECVIVTGDKDSFQLINGHTRVLHVKSRMGKTETINYTEERFREEYGFEPIKMIDLKALMGDASDNIPGVAGVGEKTAMDLVQRFGSIDALYAQLETADIKDGVRKKLAAGEESARMSYHLATIITDAQPDIAPESLLWRENFKPELYGLFMSLGFTKFIERYKLRSSVEEAQAAKEFAGECESFEIRTAAHAEAAAKELSGSTAAVWTENGLEEIVFCAGEKAWLLRKESFEADFDSALRSLFTADIKKVGHNIKDLVRRLLSRGIASTDWCFDTALAAYLLDATAGSYELDRLCVVYCGFEPAKGTQKEGQMSFLEQESFDLAGVLSRAAALLCLYESLEGKLRELGMDRLYYDIELPLCTVLAEMEQEGFLVDKTALHDFGESLTGSIDALQNSIWDHAGEQFNINSPKQLGAVLFEKLMLPAGKKTRTGWSTGAEILEKLRDKHPIINDILDYRMLTKLKSTYAEGLLKVIDEDGRIRTNFQMTVTATGRLSSTEPNLQNIPIRRELGAEIRRMFVASPGNVLVDADYSQIELRLLAHISGDENMIGAFNSGEDIHSVTASQVFDIPLEEVDSLHRSRAKAVNFGIVYGISAWSLAQDINVSQPEARAYMDAYLAKYHGVREYMKSIVDSARTEGYVSTLYGRRRYLPELKSSNFNLRSFGERVALNMPIQGTAADVIKLAMVNTDRRLKAEGLKARLILQVHDELIVECPEEETEAVKAILRHEMEAAANFSVPLTVDVKSGANWAEAH